MADPSTTTKYDMSIEEHGLRKHGMLGRGIGMGNALYSISYFDLPPEAVATIKLITEGGPFPYPGKDGSTFGNRFGDLPDGQYLEYTVRTPGVANRGMRRIVARKTTGQLFFTACHYERVGVSGGANKDERADAQRDATAALDEAWRNGFYIITGMDAGLRADVVAAIKAVS